MRKKIAMRKGAGKVAKFAGGGEVDRPARRSLISNNAVGSNRARGRVPVGAEAGPDPIQMEYTVGAPRAGALAGADMGGVGNPNPVDVMPPPVPPPVPRVRARARPARREMTADELNDREMTRILNDRSLAAAQAGRNMYAKGGMVKPRRAKKGKC